MEARWRQQNTAVSPQEEQWLIDAIKARNVYGAEAVIHLINDKPVTTDYQSHANLQHVDRDGNSFLWLSIEAELKPITELLYKLCSRKRRWFFTN